MKYVQDKLFKNMKALKTIIVALSILWTGPAFAQHELSASDKEALQERVMDKVMEFQNHLQNIVKKDELTTLQRENEIKASLVLFIGNGERYKVINSDGVEENRSAVRMQLSSLNRSVNRWITMKSYLRNLFNNVHRYVKVVIQEADAIRVDNINHVSGDNYEAMAYFAQKFIGFRDGKVVYGDITTKKIKVYIKALEVPGGVIWDAKLGDVYVTSTNPLGNGQ